MNMRRSCREQETFAQRGHGDQPGPEEAARGQGDGGRRIPSLGVELALKLGLQAAKRRGRPHTFRQPAANTGTCRTFFFISFLSFSTFSNLSTTRS